MKLSYITWAVLGLSAALIGCQSDSVTRKNTEESIKTYNIQPANVSEGFIKGMDISMLPEMESMGTKYYDEGSEKDLVKILSDHGVNYIRARLWVDPQSVNGTGFGGGNSDLVRAIELGKRAHANGMKYLLDIHYSDFWADPKKQFKPKHWSSLNFDEMVQKVYDYTDAVMDAHRDAGIVPDMVQVGNELNGGMLWPEGKSWGGDGKEFDRLSRLLKSGIQGVKDNTLAGEDIKIMLHLAEAGDNGLFRWWFDEITKHDVDFDIIGMSYYPFWHGPLTKVRENIDDVIKRYNKPVIIVETAFPFVPKGNDDKGPIEGYEVSVNGQAEYLKDLMEMVNATENNMGLGIFYWEPAWLGQDATWATKAGMDYIDDHWEEGNAWDNKAMFDPNGNAFPSLDVFNSK
ncbi:galactosidase [Vibrio sp. HA2012]|uniref:glycoside hydrolase family 53 protein n=1 Tax=Vibrio sp. HA2012 TaxID=1971595 RepID=UPI000C2CD078|nr:glycosyl hydrolase 53 family protein [Vibrio sp. HA2012]PJC87172.1 galactosidase [Vibrio sp. HA2012]